MMDGIKIFAKSGEPSYLGYSLDGQDCISLLAIPDEVAAHIAACLEACRWRPIGEQIDYTGPVLLTDGEGYEVVWSRNGEFIFSLSGATHYRPIGPLPEVTR